MIRKILTSDLELFINIRLESLRIDSNSFLSTYEEEIKNSIHIWKNYIMKSEWFGYFVEKKLIGIINLKIAKKTKISHTAEISGLFINPEFRRNNIAKKLVNFTENYSSEKNILQIYLGCHANNEKAINLYQNLGYKIIAVRPCYIRIDNQYFDDLIMYKNLNSQISEY